MVICAEEAPSVTVLPIGDILMEIIGIDEHREGEEEADHPGGGGTSSPLGAVLLILYK